MPPETQDTHVDIPRTNDSQAPLAMLDEAIPRVGDRPTQLPPQNADVSQYGFQPADTLLAFGPEQNQSTSQAAKVADTAASLVGQPLWEKLHPGGWEGDDPGWEGGLGCTASTSEALRQAGVFGPEEDETLASGLQETLEGPKHNWQRVNEWPGRDLNLPKDSWFPPADQVRPGDVIIGYRLGEGGESSPDHSGNDAHSGIVGLDEKGNLVVYSNGGNINGKEVWEARPYKQFVSHSRFDDGIVVLRAPESQSPTTV